MSVYLTLAGWAVLELGLRVRERIQGKGGSARDRSTRALIAVSVGAAIALGRVASGLLLILSGFGIGTGNWLCSCHLRRGCR